MFVYEVLNKKINSEIKIEELYNFLYTRCSDASIEDVNTILQYIFKEIDSICNCKVLLKEVNKSNFINIDNKKIDISRAVTVRDSIKEKIDVLTNLISGNIGGILGVIEQRDSLIKDFDSLNTLIIKSDLTTEV